MYSFILFLAVGLFAIGCLLVLHFKHQTKSTLSWFGSIVIIVSAITAAIAISKPYDIIPTLLFGIGIIFFTIGIYRLMVGFSQRKNNTAAEFQARTLGDILHVAASRENLIELLNYSLDRYLELFSLNSGAIHIFHKPRNMLIMGSYRGLAPSCAKKLEQLQPGQSAIGRTIQNKRVLIIRDLRVSPDYQFFGGKIEGYSFLAVAPIIVDNECWGVITLLGRKKYHRGMLDITTLEEFGCKLGQALALGRENRRMTAAYKLLKNTIEFYHRLFADLKHNLYNAKSSIFGMLADYPAKLFGGLPFCVITISSGRCRSIYWPDIDSPHDDNNALINKHINADFIQTIIKPGKFFKADFEDIPEFFTGVSFKNKKAVCCCLSFSDSWFAVFAVDAARISDLQEFNDDIQLLEYLANLEYIKSRIHSENQKLNLSEPDNKELEKVSEQLAPILNSITENIQSAFARLSQNGDYVNISELKQWLVNLERPAFKGLRILQKIGKKNSFDEIIQTALDKENLDVDFHPGIKLSEMESDKSGFEKIIKDILKESILDGKRVRLKTSSLNDIITLTIEGEVNLKFPSPELIKHAGLHNIMIELPGRLKTPPADLEIGGVVDKQTKKITVLAIESNSVFTELLKDIFSETEYNFHAETSASAGLAYLESARYNREPVDIAVIDISLQDIPGLELSRQIKDFDSRIYTILISTWGVNLYKSTLEDAGVDAVLNKPFRLEQLNRILTEWRNQNEASI
ncbi:MAG: response regulator [candidate division Zixibacteria bacterium]|nr:response regulator [candidate division Zixibacteria bacterium]